MDYIIVFPCNYVMSDRRTLCSQGLWLFSNGLDLQAVTVPIKLQEKPVQCLELLGSNTEAFVMQVSCCMHLA